MPQKFPGDLLSRTYSNPDNSGEVRVRNELERRGKYIAILDSCLYHPLVELVKQCLQDDPRDRPGTEELLVRLQGMRVAVEVEYGGIPITLDVVRLKLSKELKAKERRIEEQQVTISNHNNA